jgi:hypothetical protein
MEKELFMSSKPKVKADSVLPKIETREDFDRTMQAMERAGNTAANKAIERGLRDEKNVAALVVKAILPYAKILGTVNKL